MAEQILQVEGLTARVEDKVILHEVGLTIKKGETHVLMGPNGAGKSTLGYVPVSYTHLAPLCLRRSG